MRGSLLVVLLSTTVLACGAESSAGDACSASAPCGQGEVCDLTAPGGAICIGATGDLDGDGIANAQDFCQHAMGGAYDEDGDGLGDECDACPIGKPPASPETDGDGVDSPCDPDPRTPGDKIVLFNGFNGALPGSWSKSSAAWQVAAGEAIMTPASNDVIEQLSVTLPTPSARLAILSGYRIETVASGAPAPVAGVVGLDVRPAGAVRLFCGGSRSGTSDSLALETDAGSNTKSFTNLFGPGTVYQVAEQLSGANTSCAMIAGQETGAIQATSFGNAMTQVGLAARGVNARFAYLLVLQR